MTPSVYSKQFQPCEKCGKMDWVYVHSVRMPQMPSDQVDDDVIEHWHCLNHIPPWPMTWGHPKPKL